MNIFKSHQKITFVEHHFSILLLAVSNKLAIASRLIPPSRNPMACNFISFEYDLRLLHPLFLFLPSALFLQLTDSLFTDEQYPVLCVVGPKIDDVDMLLVSQTSKLGKILLIPTLRGDCSKELRLRTTIKMLTLFYFQMFRIFLKKQTIIIFTLRDKIS